MTMRSTLAAAVAALTMSACAPAVEQAMPAAPGRTGATLVVQNRNWLDVTVYLLRGGQRTRLGSVPSLGKGEFAIPNAYVIGVSDIIVRADPVGSADAYVSPPIQVFPGARLALTVENHLRHSNFAVYGTQ